MADLGKAYVQIIPKAEGISEKIKESVSPGAGKAGTSAGNSFVGTFAKIAGGAAVGAAVFNGMKAAIDEGAKLQQSYGGLDTLYGEASAAAKDYAMEAAKAGISVWSVLKSGIWRRYGGGSRSGEYSHHGHGG